MLYINWSIIQTGYSPAHNYFETKIQTYPLLKDFNYKIEDSDVELFGDINPIALP